MNIAIAGYGIEGQSSYSYWNKDGSNDVVTVDEESGKVLFFLF